MSYPAPILNLDFANAKQLIHPAVAFSRASARSYVDSTGTSRTARAGVPRFTHASATGESLGLMVDPQETIESVVYATDVCSVDLTRLQDAARNPLWTGTEGTIVVDAIAPPTTDESFVMMIGDANNRISIDRTAGGGIDFYAYGGSAVTGIIHSPTVGASNRFRFCYGFASGAAKLSVNGGNVLSATGLVVPSPLSTLWIGSLVGVLTWGGTFRSVQVYNRLIPDAYFPALSTM